MLVFHLKVSLFRGCSDRMVVTLSEPLRELQLDETEKSLMLAVIVFSDGLYCLDVEEVVLTLKFESCRTARVVRIWERTCEKHGTSLCTDASPSHSQSRAEFVECSNSSSYRQNYDSSYSHYGKPICFFFVKSFSVFFLSYFFLYLPLYIFHGWWELNGLVWTVVVLVGRVVWTFVDSFLWSQDWNVLGYENQLVV